MFTNKPRWVRSSIPLDTCCKNMKMEKHGSDEQFKKGCAEKFVNEMLETETYKKHSNEKKIVSKPLTKPDDYVEK